MNRDRLYDAGLLLLIVIIGTVLFAACQVIRETRKEIAIKHERTQQSVGSLLSTQVEMQAEIGQLKKELAKRIGAAGNTAGSAALSNDEIVQIYADNEAEISKLWVEMAEVADKTGGDVTLGDAVRAWLKKTKGE